MIHGDLTGRNIHLPYSFEYPDTVTRDAATGFVVADEGKLCRVRLDNTLYMLASSAPVAWVTIASNIGGGSSLVAKVGTVFDPAPANWEFFYRSDLDNLFIWNPLSSSWVDITAANSSGDMFKATYDPTNIALSAFIMDNMTQGTVNFYLNATQVAKVNGSEQVVNKGVANGYPSLDANQEVVQLPAGASVAVAGTFLRQDGVFATPAGGGGGGGSTTIPVYTQTQINGLTLTNGLTVYNSTTGVLQYYSTTSGAWVFLPDFIKKTQVLTTSATLFPRFHYHVSIDASMNPVSLTIPDPTTATGAVFIINAVDLTNNATLSIQNGLMDGINLFTFANVYDSVTILSDGIQWRIISSNIKDVDAAGTVDLTAVYNMMRQNTYNIGMNTFRLMSNGSLSKNNMVNGIVDEYMDVVNIDGTLSTYGYNAGGSYLFNSGSDPAFYNPVSFEPTVPAPNLGSNIQTALGNSFYVPGTKTITSIKIPVFNWSAVNIWTAGGTGTLDFIVCAMPAGMSIGAATDKPTYAYTTNPANQLFKRTYTEGELMTLLSIYSASAFTSLQWMHVIPAVPFTLTEGEYFWVAIPNGLPAQSGAATAVGLYRQTWNYGIGHYLPMYTSGTTFNTTYVLPAIISAQSDTVSGVVIDNTFKTSVNAISIPLYDITYDGEVGITFRVSDFCSVDSITLPICMTGANNFPATGTGSIRFAIQVIEFGTMSGSGFAYAYSYASASHTVPNLVEATLTVPQISAQLVTYADAPTAATAMMNGAGFTVTWAAPISLSPGEYAITIDARTNPVAGARVELICSNDASSGATLSKRLRMGTGSTSNRPEHPIFAVNGKWTGAAANLVVESIAEVAAVAPTSVYTSFVVDSGINTLMDLIISASRDNGVTWSPVTPVSSVNNNISVAGTKIIYGFADVSGQPTGTQVRYKIESFNSATVKIHASNLQWN